MPRLVVINRYFWPDESATARLLADLAMHLSEHHEVHVLCSRQRLETPDAGLPSREKFGAVTVHRLWSSARGRAGLAGRALDYLTFLASVATWLLVRLRRGDVVLAKTDPPMLGVAAALASYLRGGRLVHWLQDLYPETAWRLGVTREASLLGRAFRFLRNRSLRSASLVVVVSPGMGTYLRNHALIPAPKFIPNWSDDLRLMGAPPTSYRRALPPETTFVIGYSGNLGRAHPLTGLPELARRLNDDRGCHLLFTGGGVNFERLRLWIRNERIGNWTFLPYQPRERLAELIATADLHLVLLDPAVDRFVFPSKVYGVLSAGRPLLHLGNPACEVAALLQENGCGWSLPADDPDRVVALLGRLRRDPEELAKAGHRARQTYERHFAPHVTLAAWQTALAPLFASER